MIGMLSLSGGWVEVNKCHPVAVSLADRHYTRQTPGAAQFTRPGVNLVLVREDGTVVWVTWRPIPQVGRKDQLEAWECTLFRNEGASLSSDIIRQAVDITWRRWGWPPKDGFITAIGIEQTAKRRGKHSRPGACYIAAGWEPWQHPNPSQNVDKAWLKAPHPERERPRGGEVSNKRTIRKSRTVGGER